MAGTSFTNDENCDAGFVDLSDSLPDPLVPPVAFSDKGTGKGGSDTVHDNKLVTPAAFNMVLDH
eukprot:9023990-Ditylum_brightwellii.AAC.2